MKKSVLLAFGILGYFTSYLQAFHVKNRDASSIKSVERNQIENYLLGTKYPLKNWIKFASVNALGKAAGCKVKRFLCLDNIPEKLIIVTKSVLATNKEDFICS